MSAQELVKRHLLSREDYHRMAEAGLFDEASRVELIEGKIFDRAPIGPEHNSRTARVSNVITLALGQRAIVLTQGVISLGDLSEPEPDIVIVDNRWDYNPGRHPVADEIHLIVEVTKSSLLHDRDRKIPLYARFAIPEVWLIDLNAHELTVYREPVDGQYRRIERLGSGRVAPRVFPDIELDVGVLC